MTDSNPWYRQRQRHKYPEIGGLLVYVYVMIADAHIGQGPAGMKAVFLKVLYKKQLIEFLTYFFRNVFTIYVFKLLVKLHDIKNDLNLTNE